jgi:uncharacterized protein YjbI with pentapeptide repeats
MKLIKPQTLSVLSRPFEFGREFWMGFSVIAFLPIGDTPVLLPDTALWPFLAEELPPDLPLDTVIPKVQPEFLAIAHAFAPDGIAAPQVRTGIQLGPSIKMLDVFCDRLRDREGSLLSALVPFTTMPIDWAHAYGGPDIADNPLGRGATPFEGSRGRVFQVPNILNPKLGREALRIPASYGPVDQVWPARAKLTGTYDDLWLRQDYPGFARDIDWHFFNTAQPDQWLPEPLRGDETYAFKNLHPNHKLLKGRLPGMAPRLFLVRKENGTGGGFEEVPLSLTTVWFFPHRERLVLVHHGRARLTEEDGSDVARVVVGADRLGESRPAEAFQAVMRLRTDTKDGSVHALRDADLVPAAWLRPDPSTALPDAKTSPIGQMLARQRRIAERRRDAKRDELAAVGLDPDKFGPPPPPPEEPFPTLDTLADTVAKARAEGVAQKSKAEALIAAKKAQLAAQLAASGMPDAEIQQRLDAKPKGPPPFSVAAMRAEVAAQAAAMRVLGQLTMGLEAQLDSPEILAHWQQTEDAVRNAYRLTAQTQDPADALPAERSAALRRLVREDSAAARALYDLHGADLSGLDLSGLDLSGICLDGANLTGTSFANANLSNAVLAHARMAGCVLDGANLSGANLGKARLVAASLRRTILKKAVLAGADLTSASLAGADIGGADISGANLTWADFSGVSAHGVLAMKISFREFKAPGIDFTKAKFIECDLRDADMTGGSLTQARLIESNLAGIRLAGAKICKAAFVKHCSLANADLTDADLTGANLRETGLAGARLDGAVLEEADLSGADLAGATLTFANATNCRFTAADLRGADLRLANFSKADLARADVRGANLTGVAVYEANLARAKVDATTHVRGMFRTRMRYLPRWQPPEEVRS